MLQDRRQVLLAEFQHRTRNLLARADHGGIDLGGLVTAELTAHGDARTRVNGDGAKRRVTLDWTESGVHRDAASG